MDEMTPMDAVEILLDHVLIALFIGFVMVGLALRLDGDNYGPDFYGVSFFLLFTAGVLGIVYGVVGKKRQRMGVLSGGRSMWRGWAIVVMAEDETAIRFANHYQIVGMIVLILAFLTRL